jgi:hypothetical protein
MEVSFSTAADAAGRDLRLCGGMAAGVNFLELLIETSV